MEDRMGAAAIQVSDVMAYDNPRVLKRYILDHGVNEDEARRRFEGLKQFLIVCASTPGYKVTSDAIDSMWHTFLLFTKDYRDFCMHYLGKFINHEPFEVPSPESYLTTRARAHEMFGKLDEGLWPLQAKLSCSSGCE
jgi:hypothetical protein